MTGERNEYETMARRTRGRHRVERRGRRSRGEFSGFSLHRRAGMPSRVWIPTRNPRFGESLREATATNAKFDGSLRLSGKGHDEDGRRARYEMPVSWSGEDEVFVVSFTASPSPSHGESMPEKRRRARRKCASEIRCEGRRARSSMEVTGWPKKGDDVNG